jgi:hypothetical protein
MRALPYLIFASFLGSGCTDALEVSSIDQGVLEGNRIASNRIASNQLTLNRIASNRIASNRIASNSFRLNQPITDDLLATADGRELLLYIVQCALPSDVTLKGIYAGVEYTFKGDIGLASRWIHRTIRTREQRWVSACLIARVNKFEIPVPISIRGPKDDLTLTAEEAEQFSVQEGAFYGNVFKPISEPIEWVACRGRDQAESELGTLSLRKCAEPDPANPGKTLCGFTYAGDCVNFSRPRTPYACKHFVPSKDAKDPKDDDRDDDLGGDDADDELGSRDPDPVEGGYYTKCHDEPGGPRWPGATRYREVITVYLTP